MGVFFRATVLLFVLWLPCAEAFTDSGAGCWFLRPESPNIASAPETRSLLVADYFRVSYPAGDPLFGDSDRDGIPDLIQKQIPVMKESRRFLNTELGWNLPASRSELGRAELEVRFVKAGRRFVGTVMTDDGIAMVLNRRVLNSRDFPALWIHQLAHAVELQFRTSGEYWLFEATAGWMEGQFQGYSRATQKAQMMRLEHPGVSLTDVTPSFGLGASRFLEMLARPSRDVIRQVWQQWAYAPESRADEIISAVLALNHLPDLESYLQNYYLLHEADRMIDLAPREFMLAPFAAAVFQGVPDQPSGGIQLTFSTSSADRYSTSILFFSRGEKSGTLALKKGLSGESSVLIPYSGMDHFRYVVVNPGPSWLSGKVDARFDGAIPGVLEYFKVNTAQDGVQIEWKTSREHGVAFWNLYRVIGGEKVLLNEFPIPATIRSDEGVRYLFVDSSSASFYSLEAITTEGFASPLASTDSVP